MNIKSCFHAQTALHMDYWIKVIGTMTVAVVLDSAGYSSAEESRAVKEEGGHARVGTTVETSLDCYTSKAEPVSGCEGPTPCCAGGGFCHSSSLGCRAAEATVLQPVSCLRICPCCDSAVWYLCRWTPPPSNPTKCSILFSAASCTDCLKL